jgi:hypothetical protein
VSRYACRRQKAGGWVNQTGRRGGRARGHSRKRRNDGTRSEVRASFVPHPDFLTESRAGFRLAPAAGSRRPTGNRSRERTRWLVGEAPTGEGPLASPLAGEGAGMVPCWLCLVSAQCAWCVQWVGPVCGSIAYVCVAAVEETAAGVCWSCGDALQSAAFPLAWARLRSAAALALLGVTGKQLISSSGTRLCVTY